MKPTSVLFLGVSICIMIFGLIVCGIANADAERRGTPIFQSQMTDTGELFFSKSFDASELRKISVDTIGVDVTVCQTTGASRIELLNFPDGSYTLNETAKLLTFSNNSSISNLIEFGKGNLAFDGLRHYFRGTVAQKSQKSVNIYLNTVNDLQNLNIELDGGRLEIRDFPVACDYSLSVTNGSVDLSGLSSAKQLRLTSSGSDILLNGIACEALVSNQHSSNLTAQNLTVSQNVSVDIDSGNVSVTNLTPSLNDFLASLQTVRGKVTVYGTDYEFGYLDATDKAASAEFKVTVNTGDITIN